MRRQGCRPISRICWRVSWGIGDTVTDTAVVDLAVAVIRLAIRDAAQAQGAPATSARRFLAGSDGFYWWCEVAGLDGDFARRLHEAAVTGRYDRSETQALSLGARTVRRSESTWPKVQCAVLTQPQRRQYSATGAAMQCPIQHSLLSMDHVMVAWGHP